MRVKVGMMWFEVEPETPVMVELSPTEKAQIAAMHPEATRYAQFDDACPLSVEERIRWMEEGARAKGGGG